MIQLAPFQEHRELIYALKYSQLHMGIAEAVQSAKSEHKLILFPLYWYKGAYSYLPAERATISTQIGYLYIRATASTPRFVPQ